MSGSLNKAMLIGNLGADPEVRSLNDGSEVVNLRIATSERWKDRSTGEQKERTEWHRVSIFGDGLVNVAKQFLRKGSKVYVEGQIQTRQYEKDGQPQYSTDIIVRGFGGVLTMLDGPNRDNGNAAGDFQGGAPRTQTGQGGQSGQRPTPAFSSDGFEDIPF